MKPIPPRLNAYLLLERAAFELDETDEVLANKLKDLMDPLWRSLLHEERVLLNARGNIEHVDDLLYGIIETVGT